MKTRLIIIAFSIAMISVGFATYAQRAKTDQEKASTKTGPDKPEPSNASTIEKVMTPNRRRAFSLLNELVKETTFFTDGHLRIKAKAKIADSLWDYDKPQAKSIFMEAFLSIDKLDFPSKQSNLPIQNASIAILSSPRFHLRNEILQIISVRDSALAEELIATTEGSKNDKKAENALGKNNREQVLQSLALAQSIAKNNPQKAAQIVRESLKFGLTPLTSSVLLAMRPGHPEIANTLFTELISSVNNANASLSETLGPLALYILPSEMDSLSGRDPFSEPMRIKTTQSFLALSSYIISQQVTMETQGAAIVDGQMAKLDSMFLKRVTPLFARFMPEGVAIVRQRETQLSKYLSIQEADASEKRIQRPNDYTDTLNMAESPGDARTKDRLYAQAAMQATRQGKPEEGLSITDKIRDRDMREMTVSVINYQTALKFLLSSEISTAHRYAKEILFSPQRVEIYKRLAEDYISKKDIQRASEVITEIKTWLEALPAEPKKAMGLLIIAGVSSGYDQVNGFEITKLAVKAIDEADFSIKSNNQTQALETPITLDTLDISSSFSLLARADFERALLVAQSIKNKEVNVLAQLAICQAILADTKRQKN